MSEERCPICAKPFKPADICATDIEMGTTHAACLEGSPTVYLDTGEPSEGPIDTFRYDEEARERLLSLRAAGYQFGDYVIEEVDEEIANAKESRS